MDDASALSAFFGRLSVMTLTGFEVPGYLVDRMLGFGATGEVWAGRELLTAEPVALKRLVTVTEEARERLEREAMVLAGVQHPHLVRLRTVVKSGDEVVLVLDFAAGGSLAALLGARATLDPGEVVTMAAPLAEALAAVHARGVVHGDISPGNILFTSDGRPLLADLGMARLFGESLDAVDATEHFVDPAVLTGHALGPASDVWALAAVCVAALTGRPPGEAPIGTAGLAGADPDAPERGSVLAVLSSALDSDPRCRPTAAELARALFDACPAVPVRLVPLGEQPPATTSDAVTHRVPRRIVATGAPATPARGGGSGRGGDRRRRRAHRQRRWISPRLALVFAIPLLVAAAAAIGIAWAQATGGAAVAQIPSAQAQWRTVLTGLDMTRAAAFERTDAALLASAYESGSPALARDLALLEQVRTAGVQAAGMRFAVHEIQPRRIDGNTAVLEVTDELMPYVLVDGFGATVDEHAGRPATTWLVTLARHDGEWRIRDVAPA